MLKHATKFSVMPLGVKLWGLAASLILCCVVIAPIALFAGAPGRKLRRAAAQCAPQLLAQDASVLLELFLCGEFCLLDGPQKILAEQIPEWTEYDFLALTPEQRRCLRSSIIGYGTTASLQKAASQTPVFSADNPDYRIAACEVMAKFGDGADLRVLQTVGHSGALSASGRRVREAAKQFAGALEARLALQNASDSLLRASTARFRTWQRISSPGNGRGCRAARRAAPARRPGRTPVIPSREG